MGKGFNDGSSMCVGFSAPFEAGAKMPVRNGMPFEILEHALAGDPGVLRPATVRPAPMELFS